MLNEKYCLPCNFISDKKDLNKFENNEELHCAFCYELCYGSMIFVHDNINDNKKKCSIAICVLCIGKSKKINKNDVFRCACGISFPTNIMNFVPYINYFTNIKCINCNAICKNDETYRIHILEKCMKSPRICLRCNLYIENNERKNHDEKCIYQCKKCNKYIYHIHLKYHKYTCFHIKCTKCSFIFTNKSDLREHLTYHYPICFCCNKKHSLNDKLGLCTKCNKYFCRENFLNHIC